MTQILSHVCTGTLRCWAASLKPASRTIWYWAPRLPCLQRFCWFFHSMVALQPLLRTLRAAQPLSLRRKKIRKKRLPKEPLKQHRSTRQPLAWTGTMTSTCLQTTSPVPIRPILLCICCMDCMAIIAICWSALIRPPCLTRPFKPLVRELS